MFIRRIRRAVAALAMLLSGTMVAGPAAAQQAEGSPVEELVSVTLASGATQSGVLSRAASANPPRSLVVIVPGHPVLARASVNFLGRVLLAQDRSFVVRERFRLLDDTTVTLVLDCRSDFQRLCPDDYQGSETRFQDARTLVDAVRARFPSIDKVWLLSTSRGLHSSYGMATHGQDYFQGVIHTAGVVDLLFPAGFERPRTRVPQFFYHHAEDPCRVTRYETARAVANRLDWPLVTVHGGGGYSGDPCHAFTQHGFRGVEDAVMRHIGQLVRTGRLESDEIR